MAKAKRAQQSPRKKSKVAGHQKSNTGAGSKQEAMLGLLRRPEGATIADIIPEGATIADIIKATGWQPHSVRGFFASVVLKKLRLPLSSEKLDSDRTYRISDGKGGKANQAQHKRAD